MGWHQFSENFQNTDSKKKSKCYFKNKSAPTCTSVIVKNLLDWCHDGNSTKQKDFARSKSTCSTQIISSASLLSSGWPLLQVQWTCYSDAIWCSLIIFDANLTHEMTLFYVVTTVPAPLLTAH